MKWLVGFALVLVMVWGLGMAARFSGAAAAAAWVLVAAMALLLWSLTRSKGSQQREPPQTNQADPRVELLAAHFARQQELHEQIKASVQTLRVELSKSDAPVAAPPDGDDAASADADHWEGSFYEAEDIHKVAARWRIQYTDGNGKVTERSIDVRQYGRLGDATVLLAHCHLRSATRTFLTHRISSCMDLDTGELVADPASHIHAQYQNSVEGTMDALFEKHPDVLSVWLYLAKADGAMRAPEREAIAQGCIELTTDARITPEVIRSQLNDMRIPTRALFQRAVGRIAQEDRAAVPIVLSVAKAMLQAKKTATAVEVEALAYLERRLLGAPGPDSGSPDM